jgi:hypothetical protein
LKARPAGILVSHDVNETEALCTLGLTGPD